MAVSIGETISIDLSIAAYPDNDVTFTWISPRGNQSHSSAIIIQPEVVRTVYMVTVEDFGDYVCRATNGIGTSTFVFEVTEEGMAIKGIGYTKNKQEHRFQISYIILNGHKKMI